MLKKEIIILFFMCFTFAFTYSSTNVLSETGGKQETELTKKIDTKDLSGINLWIAELYNDSKVMYAIMVTLVMALVGSIIAFGADLVLKYFGMNVTRISHTE